MNSVHRKMKSGRENTPPRDPNVPTDHPISPSKNFPPQTAHFQKIRPRSDGPEDRSTKVNTRSDDQENRLSFPSDSSVKIVARIRAVNSQEREGDRIVRKVSSNSLSVEDRIFTFDSVLSSESTQEDIFQSAGVPLVKNSLAGFNTSILSYGQTGSGKTYTMWGPPSAMVEGHSPSSYQGIVPRIFQMLFSEIQKEQENSEEKQINYQCRCSFLEIYNEQIGDLLDPTQRNLQIRDDAKNGFFVENLTEEYVTTFEDVTHILIKGLSNRKVGATSINSKSSRSHIVFTCVIESWCKGISSKCFSNSKTSRISLVDLAGSERNKLDCASREYIKEGRNVKWSLSQLGKLVNILAKVGQTGKQQNAPYKDSCLTHILRESLGGNAKLTVICAISPDERCKGETLSTLRFGQQAKFIQNKAVINEITEDDVNDLSDQIRQLKEELINVKSKAERSVDSNSGYFKKHNSRESLNHLRISLNRSLILPPIDNDLEEEINVDEEDVRELAVQLRSLHASSDENLNNNMSENKKSLQFSTFKESSDAKIDPPRTSLVPDEGIAEELQLGKSEEQPSDDKGVYIENLSVWTDTSRTMTEDQHPDSFVKSNPSFRDTLSILPCRRSPQLLDPALSESPKINNNQKKSIVTSLNLSANLHQESANHKFNSEALRSSVKRGDHVTSSSLRSSRIFSGPTDSLAASLHRGLQIIDYHQQNSATKNSLNGFSFEDLRSKSCLVDKVDACVQTSPQEGPTLGGAVSSFLCAVCKQQTNGCSQVQDSLDLWIVPSDEAGPPGGTENQEPKVKQDRENVLAEAIKRERELEIVCAEQEAKIKQLNRLVEQYKHEREHSSNIEQSQEATILSLEGLMDGQIPTKDLKNEEYMSLKDENKILRNNCDNHPEVLMENDELKDLQKELDHEYKTSFDMSEREELLKEIQSLRSQLQSYMDVSSMLQSAQLRKSGFVTPVNGRSADSPLDMMVVNKERQNWTEMESSWISLTEELRLDLESNRQLAEKTEIELQLEKKCTEELDDALQRAILGHARIVEHYAELQEKHNALLGKHRKIMEGIADVKRAAAKAGAKGKGSGFIESLAAELSALRVEKERERDYLKAQNKGLRIQLRDTAEAVHAAGELLVRLREAEEAVSVAEENCGIAKQETEKVKRQMEKLKKKHAMEIVTMKQYLAESRLPESALEPLFRQDSGRFSSRTPVPEDDQAWRDAFQPVYRDL